MVFRRDGPFLDGASIASRHAFVCSCQESYRHSSRRFFYHLARRSSAIEIGHILVVAGAVENHSSGVNDLRRCSRKTQGEGAEEDTLCWNCYYQQLDSCFFRQQCHNTQGIRTHRGNNLVGEE